MSDKRVSSRAFDSFIKKFLVRWKKNLGSGHNRYITDDARVISGVKKMSLAFLRGDGKSKIEGLDYKEQ